MKIGISLVMLVSLAMLTAMKPLCAQQSATPPLPQNNPNAPLDWTSADHVVTPVGLPKIGKWMVTSSGAASDWLGELYRGKNLREPINVIIVDEAAGNADEATSRIVAASTAAGYPVRMGHSVGYQGYIDGQLHSQLPKGRDDAFSSEPFEISNNHGRIFGPVEFNRAYVFIAAFSREKVDAFSAPRHRYASFNQARDNFTQQLDELTSFKVSGFVDMNNAVLNDISITTVDHDGIAVLVRASK